MDLLQHLFALYSTGLDKDVTQAKEFVEWARTFLRANQSRAYGVESFSFNGPAVTFPNGSVFPVYPQDQQERSVYDPGISVFDKAPTPPPPPTYPGGSYGAFSVQAPPR